MSEEEKPRQVLQYSAGGLPIREARIGPFTNTVEGNLAINKLHQEGIRAYADGESSATALGTYVGASMGMYLIVHENDAERARAILNQISDKREERMRAESPQCPRCGQRDSDPKVAPERWAAIVVGLSVAAWLAMERWWLVVAAIVLGTTLCFVPTRPMWRCKNCWLRFRAPQPELRDDDAVGGD